MTLPTDYDARKALPLAAVLDYFPDAFVALAELIRVGQAQHGTTGWDRAKSKDEESALVRHFLERGTVDVDKIRHSTKVFFRAAALLQKEIEAATGAPISRGSYDSSKGQRFPGDLGLVNTAEPLYAPLLPVIGVSLSESLADPTEDDRPPVRSDG